MCTYLIKQTPPAFSAVCAAAIVIILVVIISIKICLLLLTLKMTEDFDDKLYSIKINDIKSASELLENLEEMFPPYYMMVMLSAGKYLQLHAGVLTVAKG